MNAKNPMMRATNPNELGPSIIVKMNAADVFDDDDDDVVLPLIVRLIIIIIFDNNATFVYDVDDISMECQWTLCSLSIHQISEQIIVSDCIVGNVSNFEEYTLDVA